MQKKTLTIPFYCVNSQVLWKKEAAIENAVQIDRKIIELGLDAIFTASSQDVEQLNETTKRIQIGIVFEGQSLEELAGLRKAGAAVLIFDETQPTNEEEIKLQRARELGYLILVRTAAPFDLSEEILPYVDILKWQFDSHKTAKAIFETQCSKQKKRVAQLKQAYPQLAIIYGANTISSNMV